MCYLNSYRKLKEMKYIYTSIYNWRSDSVDAIARHILSESFRITHNENTLPLCFWIAEHTKEILVGQDSLSNVNEAVRFEFTKTTSDRIEKAKQKIIDIAEENSLFYCLDEAHLQNSFSVKAELFKRNDEGVISLHSVENHTIEHDYCIEDIACLIQDYIHEKEDETDDDASK